MVTKKIVVNKNDEPTLIAEKLIDTEADTVIFSIPRFSRFGESVSNFKLIKREAEVLDKTVVIESVDEDVLTHAAAAGIEAVNPFLEQRRQRVSDITNAVSVPVRVNKRASQPAEPIEPDEEPTESEVVIGPGVAYAEEDLEQEEKERSLPEWERGEPIRPRRRLPKVRLALPKRKHLKLSIIAIAVIGLIYLGVAVLPRAEATIVTTKESWSFQRPVSVDNTATAVQVEATTIPGQVFIKREAATMKFPATGRKFVERKATGELTIYNEHSSQAQPLVVNTRFQTPSGLVFRLRSGVVVPGAKVEGGRIVPSSITVTVLADEAGTQYNVGPVPRLSIPGFAGSDKANTFYGELKAGATGGFVGETQVPTEKDLSEAKAQSAATAEETLRRQLEDQIPDDFTVLDGATKFTIFKQAVDSNVDSENNFTILTEAQVSALAFKESDLRSLVEAKLANEKEEEYMVWEDTISYGALRVQNPAAGTMSVPVEYQATLARAIDIANVRTNLRGKSEADLRSIILSLPGVENARVSLWPFWVRSVPDKESRIEITLE